MGDALIAAVGAYLLATGEEGGAIACFVFAAIRAALGVAALLIAVRALDRGNPRDHGPSVLR